jgi:hypothetical protein
MNSFQKTFIDMGWPCWFCSSTNWLNAVIPCISHETEKNMIVTYKYPRFLNSRINT